LLFYYVIFSRLVVSASFLDKLFAAREPRFPQMSLPCYSRRNFFLSDTRLTRSKELPICGGIGRIEGQFYERDECLGMNRWALALCLERIDN
jgi:hypothetical protein